MSNFLTKQIPTYMGNKRKLLKNIEEIIIELEKKENRKLTFGDGFSGSGIVSRLLKNHGSKLFTNDLAGYAKTFNKSFLSNPSKKKLKEIEEYINKANNFAHNDKNNVESYIEKYWSPKNDTHIKENERVFFSNKNGKLIDKYRYFIDNKTPKTIKNYLLASLLIEASIHNNTNGQFSAFYKKDGIGAFGGKTGTDIKRITQPIMLKLPIFSENKCVVNISQMDTNEWVKTLPEVDVIYYDPPYNKHPYSIYYFMLDIINNWNIEIKIPDTYRGQPKNWLKSKYNSFSNAEEVFADLIKNTKAKYIILSYNNGGIIPLENLDKILQKYGTLKKIPVIHKTYNKLKGIANYKRKTEKIKIKEFLWLLKKF